MLVVGTGYLETVTEQVFDSLNGGTREQAYFIPTCKVVVGMLLWAVPALQRNPWVKAMRRSAC
jgi:hypothetical protein